MPYTAKPGEAIPGRATPGWSTESLALVVKVVAESFNITEATSTAVAVVRVVLESLEISEAVDEHQVRIVLVTETLEIADGSVSVAVYVFVAPLEVAAHMSASVREATPATPAGDSVLISVSDAVGAEVVALVAVDHDVAPGQGATVLKSMLRLTLAEDLVGPETFTVQPIDVAWDSGSVTYNTLPAVRAGSAAATVSNLLKGEVVEIDVTSLVSESVALENASGAGWYGLLLTGGDGTFYAAETTGYQPTLKSEVSTPPLEPFNLRPAGGLAVSALPVLEGDFRDLDPTDVIAGIRVQVSDEDAMETPLFDSGMVDATTPRYSLVGEASLAGATGILYWQIQYRDSRGVIGPWSPVESFELVAKGVFTVDPIVPGPLPQTTAVLTGVTMRSFYLAWEHLVGSAWVTHWELPWQLAATVDVDLPNDYILQEGETYRRVLRAMDTTDRADLPDDRAFYEDIEEMTVPAAVMA